VKEIPDYLQLAYAEMHLRVREIPGAVNNPRVLEYHKPFGFKADEISWCAAFVGFCLQGAGTGRADARSYLDWGEKVEVENIQLGDILIFRRGDIHTPGISWMGHVAFYVGIDSVGNYMCLGGNQDNCVCVKAYAKVRLLGIRRSANVGK